MVYVPNDARRTYYDHEPAYRRIAATGGAGWDDLSPDGSAGSYAALQRFLGSRFTPAAEPTVHALDLGCGGGQAALLLAQHGYAVDGIDFSETAIELARRNAALSAASIRFHCGDCLDLGGFADSRYGLVIDNHVLHCIVGPADRSRFLAEAARVLRPGGVLFSETMTCEGDFDPARIGADPVTRVARNHTRYWATSGEILAEVRSAGFEILFQELVTQPDAAGSGDSLVLYARRICDHGTGPSHEL